MTTNAELHARRQDAVPAGWTSVHAVYAARARDAEIWDVEGRRYIDLASGISVLNTGHLHPRVQAAAKAQLDDLSHACFMVTPYEEAVLLAERLNALVPGSKQKSTLLVNSGAEAVENAVKIARARTGRTAVVAFDGAFHGRTMMALALTGKVAPYKKGFGPFPPDVYHVPFPYPYRDITVDDSIRAIEGLFATDVEPARVAAIVVEPVLGEGGFVVPPPDFLPRLRAVCDEHGIVLVVDEIQTGLGRTGRMFAAEHTEVEPDIVTLGKSLGGGLPLAAVTGARSIMDACGPGGLGGTFGGSPVACAAALAVLEVIEDETLVERASAIGERIKKRMCAVADDDDGIGEVRGLGAMVAIELVGDRESKQPDTTRTTSVLRTAAQHGAIVLSCGVGNVVRFLPALTASDEIIDEGLDAVEAALVETRKDR